MVCYLLCSLNETKGICTMESQGIFSGVFSTLEKVLDLRSIKHNVIVSNIANVDTPQYKAFDLIIEEELGKATGKGKEVGLKKTHPGHIPAREMRIGSVASHIVTTSQLSLKGDGNSVNIDKVMGDLAENSLMYNALAQIISKKFQGLKGAIQGGGK